MKNHICFISQTQLARDDSNTRRAIINKNLQNPPRLPEGIKILFFFFTVFSLLVFTTSVWRANFRICELRFRDLHTKSDEIAEKVKEDFCQYSNKKVLLLYRQDCCF